MSPERYRVNNQKQNRGRHRNNARRSNPARQNFDSNGPGVRIRGNATQVYDKYIQLARDAQGSGDRVLAENMLQHAEHYYRILNENQPDRNQRPQQSDPANEAQPEVAEESAHANSDVVDAENGENVADHGVAQTMARGRGRRANNSSGTGNGRGSNGRGRRNNRVNSEGDGSDPSQNVSSQGSDDDAGEAQTETIGAALAEASSEKPSDTVASSAE